MKDNICKNPECIKNSYTIQQEKRKQLYFKRNKELEEMFFQRRYTNGNKNMKKNSMSLAMQRIAK